MSAFDETTTFNVVLYFLLISLKVRTVSESINSMVSTPQVVKQDSPHCNNQLLGNINILESTKLSFNCRQIPVRLCYGIQIISKSIVFSLPPFWITRHGKIYGITHDYMLLKICNNISCAHDPYTRDLAQLSLTHQVKAML